MTPSPPKKETTSDIVPEAHTSEAALNNTDSTRLSGWRLSVVLLSIFVGLFLSFLDTTIVAVALTTIASQFDDFAHSAWVVTAYLLTYMAFGIIMARLSDIFGKKSIEVVAFSIFLVFSMACALAKNLFQLIIFRALQGIGGSALFSMTMVISISIVEPKNMPMISVVVSLTQVMSGVLGPILGGAIAHDRTSSTWRWIFWINLPLGGLALLGLLVAWPNDKSKKSFNRAAFASIDFLGAALLLAFSILLVFALQEAGTFVFAWDSAAIIVSLTLSAIALVLFMAWQELLSRRPSWIVKPIFPIEVAKMRVMGSAIFVTLLTGFVFYIAVVQLPERFQVVSGDSSVTSGIKLLPMMAASAVGSFVAGGILRSHNYTSHIIAVATSLQVLGYGLMSTISHQRGTPKAIYGFEIFLGLGFGASIASVTMMVQFQFGINSPFIAATQGALTQMRSLGGSLGLAIAVIIFNSQIQSSKTLAEVLSSEQATALYKSPLAIESFSPQQQASVAETYAEAFAQQMRVATYVIAAAFLLSLLGLERNPPHPMGLAVLKTMDQTAEVDESAGDPGKGLPPPAKPAIAAEFASGHVGEKHGSIDETSKETV